MTRRTDSNEPAAIHTGRLVEGVTLPWLRSWELVPSTLGMYHADDYDNWVDPKERARRLARRRKT